MKKDTSMIDIQETINVTGEDIKEAESIQNNPEKMLLLIDMLFLCYDEERILS